MTGSAGDMSLRDLPRDQPIPIAILARALKMRTEALRRRLLKIHEREERPVLVRIGKVSATRQTRWAVASIDRLRQVWVGFGERGLTAEELTEQLEQAHELARGFNERVKELRQQVASLRARQRATETRMVTLETGFEKVTRALEEFTATELERPTPGAFEDGEPR